MIVDTSTSVAAGDMLASQSAASRRALGAQRRTTVLSIGLAVAAGLILVVLGPFPTTSPEPILAWWSVAIISILAELMVFNVEFRKEVYSFTFSEIPLVLGLLLATPTQLIVGRLLGELVFLVVKERQSLQKLVLNLASFFGECVVLIGVSRMLGGVGDISDPINWAKGFAAVGAADLLGFVVVAKVIRWHGGPLRLRSILSIGALTAPVNTTFGLVIGIFLSSDPWASLLLLGIAVFLIVAYRSYSALSQRFESLSLLYDFTRLVSGSQRPEVVLEAILTQAKDLMRAQRAEIWLMDDRHVVGLMVDDAGRHTKELPPTADHLIEEWFHERSGTTVWTKEMRALGDSSIGNILGSNECIIAPIMESGRTVGLLAVVDRLGETGFQARESDMFATLANHASVALENGRLIDRLNEQALQLEHESLHDALTSLPNRVLFGNRLDEQVSRLGHDAHMVAVAVMDLDGFKEINDTLGHQAGDRVLIEAARRIRSIVDPAVLVARLGGDEFGLLFPRPFDIDDVTACGHAIRTQLMAPMNIDGLRINLGISIGVAIGPEHGDQPATLLQRADVAMYGAKAGLGDGVNVYSPDADTNTPRRLALANDLHTAIDNGEFHVVYQPKVSFASGQIAGFEALIRWRHPHFGNVGPDEFIPLAERTGTIQQLTDYVLHVALHQLAEWHGGGHDWSMSINLSMRNLLDSSIVVVVERALLDAGVDADHVTLEITESNVMSDPARTIATLEALARLGVRLSIDDFGTGYSSLSYLQRLPVHEIKIDKGFVLTLARDHNAEAIVRSILDLARNMDLTVVAEGIEDRGAWNMLQRFGCQEGQGYFMGKPAAPSDTECAMERIAALQLASPAGQQRPEASNPRPPLVSAPHDERVIASSNS